MFVPAQLCTLAMIANSHIASVGTLGKQVYGFSLELPLSQHCSSSFYYRKPCLPTFFFVERNAYAHKLEILYIEANLKWIYQRRVLAP